ncbi:hypothetical protein Tco_0665639 [Tanacetum coccineum]
MVVSSLDVEKDPFQPSKDDKDILGPEVPYLSAIGSLMFLASYTRPEISFSLNLLARYSSCPTRRHWNGYADAGYRSGPHIGRSQTSYVFTHGVTAISWRSVKQTIATTSSNHVEILAIHKASRECVWLRNVILHIGESCGVHAKNERPTILHEDNATFIAQQKEGFNRTKHISPKFFFTHDLQKEW